MITIRHAARRRRVAAWTAAALVVGLLGAAAPSSPAGALGFTYSGSTTSGTITLKQGDPAYQRVIANPPATVTGTYDDVTGALSGTPVFQRAYTETFDGPFGLKLYVGADLVSTSPVTGTVDPVTHGFTGTAGLKLAVSVFGQGGPTQDHNVDTSITNPGTCFVNLSLDFTPDTSSFNPTTGALVVTDPLFAIPQFPEDPNGCSQATGELNNQLAGPTNSVTLTFAGTVLPKLGAPTAVAAEAGNKQATVTWAAPTVNQGSAITNYIVTPYIGSTAQTPVTSSGTGRTKVITGLTNGTAYTFKVAAVNPQGTGQLSAASGAITPVAPATPYAPFASWSAFVKRQYLDLTTKQPTSSQLSTWVAALTNGSKTVGDLDNELRRGAENSSNVDPVVRVYRAFLGRAPDSSGLKYWIGKRRSVAPARTWTTSQIAASFTASNEFKTKYGSLSNRAFVTRIYTDVLGRTADTKGVDYWTGKLDSKTRTRAQVMVGFSESNEYKTKQRENTDVAIAYIYLLGRSPSVGEAKDWTDRQKAGVTHQVLLTELLEGNAYRKHITG